MHRIAFLLVWLAGLIAASVTPAFAEKRVALVVGNAAYQTVPQLPNPGRDASAVATISRASCWILRKCPEPLKLSA